MINPLHLPVRSSQQSSYSTLSGALSNPSYYTSTRIKRLPQRPYFPSCKFHTATSRSDPSSLQPTITFDYTSNGGKPGVSMHHLASKDCNTLAITDGNEKVLIKNGHHRMIFRILWPGYPEEWVRPIEVMSPGPITRARLGQLIAQNFLRFMEANRSVPCVCPEWSLCSGKIRFENLILVSLINTFEDSWQADVLVEFR